MRVRGVVVHRSAIRRDDFDDARNLLQIKTEFFNVDI